MQKLSFHVEALKPKLTTETICQKMKLFFQSKNVYNYFHLDFKFIQKYLKFLLLFILWEK